MSDHHHPTQLDLRVWSKEDSKLSMDIWDPFQELRIKETVFCNQIQTIWITAKLLFQKLTQYILIIFLTTLGITKCISRVRRTPNRYQMHITLCSLPQLQRLMFSQVLNLTPIHFLLFGQLLINLWWAFKKRRKKLIWQKLEKRCLSRWWDLQHKDKMIRWRSKT